MSLEHVKEQTNNICLAAVKQNGESLAFVLNQTQELCQIAVENTEWAIEYVKNQTLDVCLTAIEKAHESSNVHMFIKICPNSTHSETHQNLLKKKDIITKMNKEFN
jgi:hypothetical protein